MPREFTFRDAGVRSPGVRLIDGLGQLVGFPWKSFDPEEILQRAQRISGLEDAGDPSYREPLEVLCEAIPREARLSPLGTAGAQAGIVGALVSRLRVVDWARRHPETAAERIVHPWIVVGLPRSGTSFLSFLMELDPRSRAPLQWEALDPIPPPDLATHATDPRIFAAARQLGRLTKACPPLNAVHPMDAGLPAEDVSILMYSMRSFQFETLGFAPSYGRWLDAADMGPGYGFFKKVLQIWQSTIPVGAWSLKCPQHLGNLRALLDVFEAARIVWIHRDPARALPSLASMMMAYLMMGSRSLDPVEVAGYWTERMAAVVDRATAFDAGAPDAGWCCHVQYDRLMEDPVATVRGIYAHFDVPLDPLHVQRVGRFVRQRRQDHYGRHVYRLEDFGMSLDAIDQRFATYRARFGVRRENR